MDEFIRLHQLHLDTLIEMFKGEDYQRLLNLGARFRNAVIKAVRMLYIGMDASHVERVITRILNQGYAKSVVDTAKLIIKGARYHNSNPLNSEVRKLFIISKGRGKGFKGNQNIRLISNNRLLVNYNFNGKSGRHDNWVRCEVKFGDEYLPMINELIRKALNEELSYTARIVFRDEKDIPTLIHSNRAICQAF